MVCKNECPPVITIFMPPKELGGLSYCRFLSGGSIVVDLLFNVLLIVCGSSVFGFVSLCITLCPF